MIILCNVVIYLLVVGFCFSRGFSSRVMNIDFRCRFIVYRSWIYGCMGLVVERKWCELKLINCNGTMLLGSGM